MAAQSLKKSIYYTSGLGLFFGVVLFFVRYQIAEVFLNGNKAGVENLADCLIVAAFLTPVFCLLTLLISYFW